MLGRRAFVAGSIAVSALPVFAAKPPPPPKIGAIRWPGVAGYLHGFMAIPAKAHGRQPAVLVIPETSNVDRFALSLTDTLALAGFVACVPKLLPSPDDAQTTLRWLATNRYATGKVAAIGFGPGAELINRIADDPQHLLAAGVTFGAPGADSGPTPMLRFEAIGALEGQLYDRAWRQTVGFLKEHLA